MREETVGRVLEELRAAAAEIRRLAEEPARPGPPAGTVRSVERVRERLRRARRLLLAERLRAALDGVGPGAEDAASLLRELAELLEAREGRSRGRRDRGSPA